jgi:hypothetical protein
LETIPNRARFNSRDWVWLMAPYLRCRPQRDHRVPEHYKSRRRFLTMSVEDQAYSTKPGPGSRAVILRDGHPDAAASPRLQSIRLDTPFVAQLIATADDLPQTRQRRRADPRDALAAYRLADGSPASSGLTRRVA